MHEAIAPSVTYLLNELIWEKEHRFSSTKTAEKLKRIRELRLRTIFFST